MTDTVTLERRSRRATTIQLAAVVLALFLVGLLTVQGSRAAFTASTDNGVNNFSSGTVVLEDDDDGNVAFNLTGMVPGTTATRCINVTYTGSVTANVHLYGTVAGTGLASYLDTTIDIGTGATGGTGFDCTGFTGPSNLFTDTMTNFGSTHTNFSNGLAGFDGATNPTTRSYRITVALQDDDAAQGLTATATFTWEAQNT